MLPCAPSFSRNGRPVSLGSDGSKPTGTAPPIYLKGPASTWGVNSGTGGNFTVVGSFSDAATKPSLLEIDHGLLFQTYLAVSQIRYPALYGAGERMIDQGFQTKARATTIRPVGRPTSAGRQAATMYADLLGINGGDARSEAQGVLTSDPLFQGGPLRTQTRFEATECA